MRRGSNGTDARVNGPRDGTTLRHMNKRNPPSGIMIIMIAAAAAGVAAYLRRPVKPPIQAGSWHPAESQRTHR